MLSQLNFKISVRAPIHRVRGVAIVHQVAVRDAKGQRALLAAARLTLWYVAPYVHVCTAADALHECTEIRSCLLTFL
jgi:hypothetical protein